MRISELTAFHVHIPLRRTVRHASHTRSENDTLIVRCRLEDGTQGWGEGLPREYVTGENIASTFEHLAHSDLASQLGENCPSLATAVAMCRALQLRHPGVSPRDCFGNAARCAVELSVLDAYARLFEKPLSAVTQLVPEVAAIRQQASEVRYSGAITSTGPLKQTVLAFLYWWYGFRQVKAKVGMPGGDDVKILGRIRRAMGRGIDLRIDANEAWTPDELEQRVQPLLKFGISSLEQPVHHTQAAALAALRPRLGVPIMLDESLCSLGDARLAVELGTCDLFNIRLSKCGGFLNSLLIAAHAHRHGLGYQLGCQVGETGILSAAGRHFATSVADIRYLEGSYDKLLVREPLTVEDVTFTPGGTAPALTAPGLSVTIDESAIRRLCRREEHFPIGRTVAATP